MPGIFGQGDIWTPQQIQQQQGGIFGPQAAAQPDWARTLSLFGAGLADAGANFSGHPADAVNLKAQIAELAQQKQLEMRQQLLGAINSNDPAVRAQGYQAALAMGVDPAPFQKAAASAALPKLLSAMQPQLNDNPVTVTPPVTAANPLDSASRQSAYAAPVTSTPSLTDALTRVGSPELSAQLAPDLIKRQLDQADEAAKPFDLSPGQHRFVGGVDIASLPEKNNPNQPFNIDGTPNKAYQAYERAKLAAQQAPQWANYNLAKTKLDASVPDDATLHDMATRWVNGDRQAAAGMSRNPMAVTAFQNMISQVGRERGLSQQQISQNLQTFHAGTKAVQAFDTGPQGNTTRSLNVAIQHLDTLGQLSDALKNNDVQALNKIGNYFSAQTGNPAPTNFNAAKAIVGDEIIKAIVGSGGALADRENAQNQISAASSPQQLQQVIQTYKQLMAGQLHGLRQQYESSTGMKDFNDKLFPETVAQLENAPGVKGGAGGSIPPAARAQLRENMNTTFANGQVWTLKNGKPQRVK